METVFFDRIQILLPVAVLEKKPANERSKSAQTRNPRSKS